MYDINKNDILSYNDYEEFINGNNLLDFSDYAIDFDNNTIKNKELFKRNAIIFCKTDFLPILFDYIKFSPQKYILITHMSDHPIDHQRFNSRPSCIVKWFAQNAIVDDPDLIPIPLGIENHKGKSKGSFTNHKWLLENIEELRSNEKENVFYCNWNTNTNIEVRQPILDSLKNSGKELIIESGLSFEQYCRNMSKCKYVVCPPGNGVDTHRVWEALYMGCFPIVKKHRIYKYYDLPIIQVNNWDNIDTSVLYSEDMPQIYMDYWKTLIKKILINIK